MSIFSRACRLRLPVAAMAVAAVVVLCLPAHAVKVTNVTTGTVLFDDDFETDTLSVPPGPAGNPGWTYGKKGSLNPASSNSTVEDATTLALPGPFQGSNYLHVQDSSNLIANWPNQTTSGDHIHAEWMYWIPTGAEIYNTAAPFFFGVDGGAGGAGLRTVYFDNVACSAWCDAGHTTMAYETWQKWEIDYNIGDPTFAMTVDGETTTGLLARIFGSPGEWGAVEFVKRSTQTDIDNYIDAVPEPATCVAMLIGLLALACSYRGRRAG